MEFIRTKAARHECLNSRRTAFPTMLKGSYLPFGADFAAAFCCLAASFAAFF